jgi:hypothetical protein
MSERDSTDPEVSARPDGVISGEAVPPDEHTLQVRVRKKKVRVSGPETILKVHDGPKPEPAVAPASVLAKSESMGGQAYDAARSKKRARRERDRRAEKLAFRIGVAASVLVALIALLAVQMFWGETESSLPNEGDVLHERTIIDFSRSDDLNTDEDTRIATARIPALRALESRGLTIVAEGIPEVNVVFRAGQTAEVAALETCRFAYAVWEFSPNRRFRFLPTCPALDGQILVGAYDIQGSVVRMSALITEGVTIQSAFSVLRPSRIESKVTSRSNDGLTLQVWQIVTAVQSGMDGEAMRDAFKHRNSLNPQAPATEAMPSTPPPPPKDPILRLLEQSKE